MPSSHAALRARTGCDLQRIDDVADAIRAFGARYLDRVYTEQEQSACSGDDASCLAARFAAKEAVIKLIGTGEGVDPRSIEIVDSDAGRPEVRLSGRAAGLAQAAGLGPIDVSLSRTDGLALATAVALQHVPEETADE